MGVIVSQCTWLFKYLVFDSETNAWKELVFDADDGTGNIFFSRDDRVVLVGHSLYWLAPTTEIVVFDLYNEGAWKKFPLPSEIECIFECRVCLFEVEGSLLVTKTYVLWRVEGVDD